MRKPETIESLYLDFDGFFASVMQQAMPALRGRPVGVIPFESDAANSTVVIACSKEAKAQGCQNVMRVPEARRICPDIILVTQRPDLFRRAHNSLLNEISCEIPIETVKSIDELCCRLDPKDSRSPEDLSQRLKQRIAENVGPYITCSIGFAANRLLAKTACKMDKPNGTTIWHPDDMPGPLLGLKFEDISGIGARMQSRLENADIITMRQLLATQPKQLRKIWGNVNGERMWYALHGYEVYAMPTSRGMYGHGRVLAPGWRTAEKAETCSRLLLMKAARRMRRDGYYARRLYLWLDTRVGGLFSEHTLPSVHDDHSCLNALKAVWDKVRRHLSNKPNIIRVGVTLLDIVPAKHRQLDMFMDDDRECQRWEKLTHTVDGLNHKFGKRVVTLGEWTPPPGGFTGGKIAFTRIPDAEDFW